MDRLKLFEKPLAFIAASFFLTVLLFILFLLPISTVTYGAEAATVSFGGGIPNRQYSDYFLSTSIENLDGTFIKVRGNYNGNSFICSDIKEDEESEEYYLKIDCAKFTTTDGERALDDEGRIILPPSNSDYSFNFADYGSAVVALYKNGTKTDIPLAGKTRIRVQKKEITVAIDQKYKNDDPQKEGDYIVNRVYGDDPLPLEFSVINEEESFPFKKSHNHLLDCTGKFEGNEKYADCGKYEVEIIQEGVKIVVEGNDISDCYDIKCDQSIFIDVAKREINYPAITSQTAEYTMESKEDSTLFYFSSTFSWTVDEGFSGNKNNDAFSFKIKYVCNYEEIGLDDNGNLKVNASYYYTPVIDSITFRDKEISKDNFYGTLLETDNYIVTIIPKRILIYLEGKTPSDEYGIDTKIAIQKKDFSATYGDSYVKTNEYTLTVESLSNMELKVTYSFKDYDKMYNAEGAKITSEGLVLEVRDYTLVDVKAENENFEVTVDESLVLTITKGNLSIEELLETDKFFFISGENKIPISFVQYGDYYNVLSKEYKELQSGINDYKLLFKKTISDKTFDYIIDVSFDLNEGLPGIYTPKSCDDNYYGLCEQYLISGLERLSVTINKPLLAISVSNKEYDGESFEAPSLDAQKIEELPLQYEYSYKNAKGSALSKIPVDAGSYKLVIALKNGSENLYRFENDAGILEIPFEITKREVTVDATLSDLANGKPFGQSVSIGKIVTFDIYHTNNKSLPAVIEKKELVTANCDGIDSSATPGEYSIKFTANSKLSANYNISYAQKNLKMAVIKTDITALTKSGALKPSERDVMTTKNSLGLVTKELYSADLSKYLSIEYRLYDESNLGEWISVSGLTTPQELDEGAKYQLRYVLSKNNPFVSLDEDFKSDDSDYTIVAATKIDIPIIANAEESLSSSNITIIVVNFDIENTYYWVISYYDDEEGYLEKEYLLDPSTDKGDRTFRFDLSDAGINIFPDTEYRVILKRLGKNQEVYVQSEPLDILTARTKPSLEKASFVIGQNNIDFYKSDLEEQPRFVYYYVLIERGHTSIESATNAENSEMKKYFTEEQYSELVIKGEGSSITELESDCIYALKIAYAETEEKGESDAAYFMVHTLASDSSSVASTGIINTISKYLLPGGTALFFILFVIVTIKYTVIGKRLRRRVK